MTRRIVLALIAAMVAVSALPVMHTPAHAEDVADTALVMAVDISQSVDETRYRLQMEGIAQALEDAEVVRVITSGPRRAILFTLVGWADRARVLLPWTWIASASDARAVASMLRSLPVAGGDYTCVGRMMKHIGELTLEQMPGKADRVVVDVSGDGPDNCTSLSYLADWRAKLLAKGAIVNGLPILEDGIDHEIERWNRAPGSSQLDFPLPDKSDAKTLTQWYERHVMAGEGSFVVVANGYDDFARAIRRKFVMEISGSPAAGNRLAAR
jgi:hypothetical protein